MLSVDRKSTRMKSRMIRGLRVWMDEFGDEVDIEGEDTSSVSRRLVEFMPAIQLMPEQRMAYHTYFQKRLEN